MWFRWSAAVVGAIVVGSLLGAAPPQKPHLIVPTDESGVYGYKDTPIQPWSGFHVHDPDRPIPKRVDPGPAQPPVAPPADAVVLFDGKDLSQWNPLPWTIEDGCLVADKGLLTSKEEFGDCQLHLEWMAPDPPAEQWGNRGNNGVKLLNMFEIQIYDSYTTQIYPDGQASAIYSQTPPLVNACRKPGQWQTYDIVLTVPVYEGDKMVAPPRITMFHNGLLVHLNDEVYGTTPHAGLAQFPEGRFTKAPISLMGHHCPVRFRNIWVRPLDLKSNKTMAPPEK
jgi:hypothetical protein